MKNYQTVESRESRVESRKSEARRSAGPRPSTLDPRPGFTLIELLVIIAIMGVLAALLFPVVGAVKKRQYLFNAQAEMAKLETAIDRYKAAYGFYPPDNQLSPANPKVNQLYYELTGTTNISPTPNPPVYQSLDGSLPTLTGGAGGNVQGAFGVGGFMNCSKPVGGEDSSAARNFLPDLKPNQVYNFTNITTGPQGVNLLITAVGGPYAQYLPLDRQDENPWRYNSSNPTNNPGAYELWIQLVFAPGQTNLICNWTKQVQINSPLP
jgi:prepilin-type N-terminal cleavage/methylation domain-containing protein